MLTNHKEIKFLPLDLSNADSSDLTQFHWIDIELDSRKCCSNSLVYVMLKNGWTFHQTSHSGKMLKENIWQGFAKGIQNNSFDKKCAHQFALISIVWSNIDVEVCIWLLQWYSFGVLLGKKTIETFLLKHVFKFYLSCWLFFSINVVVL